MDARLGPSQEMKEFYKTQTESLKATREAAPATKMNKDKLVLVVKEISVKDDGRRIPQVTKPRLAHSLQFGYMTGSHVCRKTVWKFYDCGEFLTLKNFSSNNSGITCKVQKKISMEDGSSGEIMGTSEKDWKPKYRCKVFFSAKKNFLFL